MARPNPMPRPPLGDAVRLAPLSHYGAFKVCNELNARVYWLDHGITSIGLRPWTVYGVGRDFGMTSEPTKAIKSVAVGRPYRISYGGKQDLQYVATSPRRSFGRLDQPFEGADAFNLRGAVEPIERFVSAFCEAVPEARTLVSHGDRQLPIAPDLDDSRLEATLGPIPRTSLRDGIAETYRRFVALRDRGPARSIGSVINKLASRLTTCGRRSAPALVAPVRHRRLAAGARPRCAGGGKRSLGIGLMSILARCRSALTTFLLELVAELLQDVGLVLLEVDGLALFAIGHLDQMEAEGSFDGVGDHALLELEGDVGEFLDEAGVEREVIEVAAGAAGVRRVLRVLVGGRREGDRVPSSISFLILRELLLGFFLFGRGRIGSTLMRMWLARSCVPLKRSLWAATYLLSSASVALESRYRDPSGNRLPKLLPKIGDRGVIAEELSVAEVGLLGLELLVKGADLLGDLLGDRDLLAGDELVDQVGVDDGLDGILLQLFRALGHRILVEEARRPRHA